MKTHALTMSIAVLAAGFLGGCEEQGSGPVGPEGVAPQFAKKSCAENSNQGSCKDGGGGGGGGLTVADATVDMPPLEIGVPTNGLITTGVQDVRIQKETKRELALEDVRDADGNSTFRSEIALTATRALMPATIASVDAAGNVLDAAGKVTSCKVNPPDGDLRIVNNLADKLTDPDDLDQVRFFGMGVDKTRLGEASDKHGIAQTWREEDPDKLFSLRVGSVELLPGSSATVTLIKGDIDGNSTLVFSGGGVLVSDRSGQVKDFVKLACPNKDIITVTVTRK